MSKWLALWSLAASPPPPPPPNLDAYTTSMFGCYGTSRLLTAYSGAALQVRRSSDNATQDIAFLSGGGLDTASMLSFCGGGNGFVSIFYDQSGNGKHLTQSTAAMQPQIVSSGSYLGHLAFDGSNDNLASPAFGTPTGLSLYMRSTQTTTNDGRLAVLDNGNVSQASCVFDYQHSTLGFRNILATQAGANLVFGTYTGLSLSDHVRAIVSDITQSTSAARLQLYLEGVSESGSFSTSGTISTSDTFGAGLWGIGGDTDGSNACIVNVVSCVIYEAAHNSTTVGAITTVLDNYS